eukprot:gene10741-7470_t
MESITQHYATGVELPPPLAGSRIRLFPPSPPSLFVGEACIIRYKNSTVFLRK